MTLCIGIGMGTATIIERVYSMPKIDIESSGRHAPRYPRQFKRRAKAARASGSAIGRA